MEGKKYLVKRPWTLFDPDITRGQQSVSGTLLSLKTNLDDISRRISGATPGSIPRPEFDYIPKGCPGGSTRFSTRISRMDKVLTDQDLSDAAGSACDEIFRVVLEAGGRCGRNGVYFIGMRHVLEFRPTHTRSLTLTLTLTFA